MPAVSFWLARRKRIAVWRIDYSERARPTLIRGREGEYVPARGAFWIRQEDGAVLQTRVRAEVDRVGADILVEYCQPAGLSMLVPCTMREKYDAGAQQKFVRNNLGVSRIFAKCRDEIF